MISTSQNCSLCINTLSLRSIFWLYPDIADSIAKLILGVQEDTTLLQRWTESQTKPISMMENSNFPQSQTSWSLHNLRQDLPGEGWQETVVNIGDWSRCWCFAGSGVLGTNQWPADPTAVTSPAAHTGLWGAGVPMPRCFKDAHVNKETGVE